MNARGQVNLQRHSNVGAGMRTLGLNDAGYFSDTGRSPRFCRGMPTGQDTCGDNREDERTKKSHGLGMSPGLPCIPPLVYPPVRRS